MDEDWCVHLVWVGVLSELQCPHHLSKYFFYIFFFSKCVGDDTCWLWLIVGRLSIYMSVGVWTVSRYGADATLFQLTLYILWKNSWNISNDGWYLFPHLESPRWCPMSVRDKIPFRPPAQHWNNAHSSELMPELQQEQQELMQWCSIACFPSNAGVSFHLSTTPQTLDVSCVLWFGHFLPTSPLGLLVTPWYTASVMCWWVWIKKIQTKKIPKESYAFLYKSCKILYWLKQRTWPSGWWDGICW